MFSFFRSDKNQLPDLSFIGVDMHSHLLPGLDDGLQTMEDTLSFMQYLRDMGYQKFICTPHILHGVHPNSPETILPALEAVRAALKEKNIDIQVEAGAEYMIDQEFQMAVENGDRLLTFGKNYILVEMSYITDSPYLQKVIFDLRMMGLQPILAHPERYTYYHHRFQQYEDLRNRGCLFQINLLSLSGYYGKHVKKVAEKLVKNNMVEFIGTDMHHANHLNATIHFTKGKKFKKILEKTQLMNKSLL